MQQQKVMMYIFPIIFAVSGVNFPVGVLIYWGTTNLWTMGQQFYVIKRNPTPGSPAYEELMKKRAAKDHISLQDEIAKDLHIDGNSSSGADNQNSPESGQRKQPKKKKKKK